VKELLDLRTRLADLRGTLRATINSKKFFSTRSVTEKLDKLKDELGPKGGQMANPAKVEQAGATTVVQEAGLLDQIVEQGRFGAEVGARSVARIW